MSANPSLPGFPVIWSPCERYRYTLWRTWQRDLFRTDEPFRYLMVLALNPSTADQHTDDPTVARCWTRAYRLGYDAMCMMNLFAYRATNPKEMKIQAASGSQKSPSALLLF